MNKKWINSPRNCEAYFSFEGLSFDHRIVMAKVLLGLRRNKKQIVKITRYNWSSLTNRDTSCKCAVTVRNKSRRYLKDVPRMTNMKTSLLPTAAECLSTNSRVKCGVPWESQVVRKKRDNFLKKHPY